MSDEPEIVIEYEEEDQVKELEIEFKWSEVEPGKNGWFTVFKGADDNWYFNLKAPNGEIILASEAYNQKQAAMNGIQSVKDNAELSNFEKLSSASGQPYFVLKARNKEIIGISQMYKREHSCDKGINSVIAFAKSAVIKSEKKLEK
ncbi:YegP family protein [candidate division KSB1 bacterium]|nr:YegP family protein [candidate division KSB1 bacterium]